MRRLHSTLPPSLLEHGHESVRDLLRSPTGERPADDVGEHAEHQAVSSGHRGLQAQDRVAGEPGEQRSRLVGVESSPGHGVRRQHADSAVPGERHRVLRRDRERREQSVGQVESRLDERSEQTPVCLGVGAEPVGSLVDRPVQHGGAPAIERMYERHVGLDPLEAVITQRQVALGDRSERRRPDGKRMNRRAHVVQHAGQRELLGAGSAARARIGLEHGHVPTGPGEGDRRHESVRPCPDDHSTAPGSSRHRSVTTLSGGHRQRQERFASDDQTTLRAVPQGRERHFSSGAGTPVNTLGRHLPL